VPGSLSVLVKVHRSILARAERATHLRLEIAARLRLHVHDEFAQQSIVREVESALICVMNYTRNILLDNSQGWLKCYQSK